MRVTGRALATIEVVTVTRPIERGGILKESDVPSNDGRAPSRSRLVTGRQQAVGLAARSVLQSGRPFRVADLIKPDWFSATRP